MGPLYSITLRWARTFGPVGESGSGKSTILRAITGLAPDWCGQITVDGKEIGKHRSESS